MLFSFVAGQGECDEDTVVLKIENFSEFLKMSNEELEEHGITFHTGGCRKHEYNGPHLFPAHWKYYFKHTKEDEEDWFGGFLKFDREVSIFKPVKASHSVSLSSGGKLVTSFTAKLEEYENYGRGNEKLIRQAELLEKTKGDVLEVTLLMKVFSSLSFTPYQEITYTTSAGRLSENMISDLVKMLESGDGANVEIKVPSEVDGEVDESSYTRKVHKGILMARSSVFSKMFAKESTMTEAQTGKVIIKDLTPKGLDIFLRFLYTGEVLKDWVHIVPELLNAAEKYNCEELKKYCGSNIKDAVSTRNALELYKLADLHGLTAAAETVLGFISKNTKAVIDPVVKASK